MNDEDIVTTLKIIKIRFEEVVEELKKKNGIINSEILDLIDDINHLSVEI